MLSGIQACATYIIVDALCIIITIIIASNVSRDSGSEMQVRLFFLLLTSNIVFDLFDALWAIFALSGFFDPGKIVLSVINGINLTAIAFIAFFWFCYTLARFNSTLTNRRSKILVAAIPAILVPILHCIGHAMGANLILTADGTIENGTMHLIISCVPLLYLIAASVVALRYRKRATSSAERRMGLVFVLFMIAPAAAAIFDMVIANTPVAAASIIISFTFVMMSMQESRIFTDTLTGLNNRRRAEAFLEESMSHVSIEKPLYVFSIDMDHFKDINDTYGHLEGDHALQLMGDALRRASAQTNAFSARWGGDEFVMIWQAASDSDPDSVVSIVQDELKRAAEAAHVRYRLACSIGYAACRSASTDRAMLLADADAMLYRHKQSRSAATAG